MAYNVYIKNVNLLIKAKEKDKKKRNKSKQWRYSRWRNRFFNERSEEAIFFKMNAISRKGIKIVYVENKDNYQEYF